MLYVLSINIITYVVFRLDKRKAKQHADRISEQTLFMLSCLGGSIGALLAMFGKEKHKTKKWRFLLGIPLICLIQMAIIFYLLFTRKAQLPIFMGHAVNSAASHNP
jgi:uncharacterized membrane protein YsdA (DUF1294 family)